MVSNKTNNKKRSPLSLFLVDTLTFHLHVLTETSHYELLRSITVVVGCARGDVQVVCAKNPPVHVGVSAELCPRRHPPRGPLRSPGLSVWGICCLHSAQAWHKKSQAISQSHTSKCWLVCLFCTGAAPYRHTPKTDKGSWAHADAWKMSL